MNLIYFLNFEYSVEIWHESAASQFWFADDNLKPVEMP